METLLESSPSLAWRPQVHPLPAEADLARALAGIERGRRPVLLDSAAGSPRRFSLLALDPRAVLSREACELADVRRLLAALAPAPRDELPGPFHGGFLGAFSYDLGIVGERPLDVAPEPWGLPRMVGGVYTDFVVLEESSGRGWLVQCAARDDLELSLEQRRAELLELLCAPPAPAAVRTGTLVRHVTAADHVARIEDVRAAIARGDVYQVNLAHRFSAEVHGAPQALYERLRRVNPAPFMAWLAWEDGALLSASPELFLDYDGHQARTRPIKGTRPRSTDPRRDRELAAELLASEKDLAELTMIVDLERNDLGRVARPGSVHVEGLPWLESYARVHHLMADVVARPRPGSDALDLVGALFPGGSVTGAPKLAAMQRIAALEGEGRGFFCGAAGFVDRRGHALLNLLIRTLQWRPRADLGADGGEVSFHVGGGITWSSDAAAEERETLDKAAGLLDALGVEP